MKFAPRDDRSAGSARRLTLALAVAALLPLILYASVPAWWTHRGVLIENATADDYAPVNQGQLKNIAKAAAAEMDAKLSGGAGDELHTLIESWSNPGAAVNDFAPLNLGQLKSTAKPFYDRMILAGLVDYYPWLGSHDAADDFAVANIGQVKSLFSFEIPRGNSLNDPLGDRLAAAVDGGNLALESSAVWNWGGPLNARSIFERNYPRRISGLFGVSSVAVGGRHLVALDSDGTVWAWGENDVGQLGDGTNTNRNSPAAVPSLSNIVAIKAGGRHTLAVKLDGTVLAWGYNRFGQLGTGDLVSSSSPNPVAGLDKVQKVSAGDQRSLAIKNDGTLWIWGYDHYAEGNGGNIFHTTPVLVPGLIDVVDVTSGYEHMVAVKSDGTVWAWGSNHQNQVGNGNPWWIYQNTPFQVPNLSNIVKVASSGDHTLALSSEGLVWAWGYNLNGQLGDGTNQVRQGPVQVLGLSNVVAIATAYSYSLAMKSDGTVWAWGEGAVGTLPGSDRRVPQQVVFGLYDTNHNGIDDRWETEYFGNLDHAGNADFDGDGIPNFQEFLRGTDPRDYFNGLPPIIEIVSGNNQFGAPGTLLPKPVTVRIRNASGQLLTNAPVDFGISNGTGLITTRPNEPLRSAIIARTDSVGQANAYVRLPEQPGTSTRITVSPAVADASARPGSVNFRASARFVLPSAPTPAPDPNATPTPTPSPTATPSAPYRYAIIDLGKDLYPIRVNNKGVVLLQGIGPDGNWGYYRWKGGTLERLDYSGPTTGISAVDINDEGTVVGSFRRDDWGNNETEVEIGGGLVWPPTSSNAGKISAPAAFPGFGPYTSFLTFRNASLSAIDNSNNVFGSICTGTVRGFLYSTLFVMNGATWLPASVPTMLSAATAINDDNDNRFVSRWSGWSDTVLRASTAGAYIGRRFTPLASMDSWFIQGTETGMINGEPVSFDPVDINEAGLVVGNSVPSGAIVIRTPRPSPSPPATPVPGTPKYTEKILEGGSPLAINGRALPLSSPGPQSSPTPSPSPNSSPSPSPSPAPQILAWAGEALVIWERQQDDETWHPFGLEEMIPSMDGWQYLEPYDMNDTGAIVGRGWYIDPSIPGAQGEYHAFLLVPVELVDTKNKMLDDGNDVIIEPREDGADENLKSIAWIDPHGSEDTADAPDMPQLALRFRGTETLGLKIKWKLKVEHKRRNGRVVAEDKVLIPAAGGDGQESWHEETLDGAVEIYAHAGWTNELQQKDFFGGDAQLTYQLLKSDGTALGNEEKTLFYIGGKNPDDSKCKAFVTETATQVQQPMAWFAYAIAKHESKNYNGVGSRYNQFWDKASRFAGVDHQAGEVLWVNNPGEKPPKGFGLFQVTGNAAKKEADIPRNQLWNWQHNVRGGLAIVASKRGIADRYFASIQKKSTQHRTAFQECLPPSISVDTHTFSSADAIQIYGYNGTGRGIINVRYPFDPSQPCGLGATKRWFWNPHHVAGGEPYIKKVEREL